MHPLTVAMPDVEVPRSDVVAVRIARKMGPLFGVTWEHNLFGETWVCDFGAITLAEIARGAPYPPKETQAAMDADESLAGRAADGGRESDIRQPADGMPRWHPAGRAIWTANRGPTPTAISNATLNRYGPDTKSAVVLTGANRLLKDVTAAIAQLCSDLERCRATPEMRLAVWAGLVLEAFRGQPAVVAAAIQARTIQRALTTPWGQHLLMPGLTDSARCEFGAARAGSSAPQPSGVKPDGSRPDVSTSRPTSFDLIDSTLPLLGLPLPVADGPLLSRADLLDDIATQWCRRLLQVGHPGRGITWVEEEPHGHRRVHSYLRVGSAVAPFVADTLALLSITPAEDKSQAELDLGPIRALTADDDLGTYSVTAQRVRLISAHLLANYLRFNDDLLRHQPGIRAATRALTSAAAYSAAKHLGLSDPVSLLLSAYTAYCAAWDFDREPGYGEDGARAGERNNGNRAHLVASRARAGQELTSQLDLIISARRAGIVDPGTASYLIEVGAMALERLVPAGDTRRVTLSGYWREAMLARGLDPDSDLTSPATLPAAQQYHLQNYAAFLAAEASDMAGLRQALAAQEACTAIRDLVAQGELADYRSKFTSVRTSHQAAAVIVGRMLTLTDSMDGAPSAVAERRALVAAGVRHARAALTNPASRPMIDGDDPEVIALALALLPVLTAVQEPDLDLDLQMFASRLLRSALRQAELLGPSLSEESRANLAELAQRLAAAAPTG